MNPDILLHGNITCRLFAIREGTSALALSDMPKSITFQYQPRAPSHLYPQ